MVEQFDTSVHQTGCQLEFHVFNPFQDPLKHPQQTNKTAGFQLCWSEADGLSVVSSFTASWTTLRKDTLLKSYQPKKHAFQCQWPP